MADNEKTEEKATVLEERAILIENILKSTKDITEEKIRDRLTIHFQKKSYGGGDVEQVTYPLPSHPTKAVIVFSQKIDLDFLIGEGQHIVEVKKGANMHVKVGRLPKMFEEIKVVVNPFYLNIIPRDNTVDLQRELKYASAELEQSETSVTINIQDFSVLETVRNVLVQAACLQDHVQNNGDVKTNRSESHPKRTPTSTNASGARKKDGHSRLPADKLDEHANNASNRFEHDQFAASNHHDHLGKPSDTSNPGRDIPFASPESNEQSHTTVERKTPALAPLFSNPQTSSNNRENAMLYGVRKASNVATKMGLASGSHMNSTETAGLSSADNVSASREQQYRGPFSVNPLLFHYLNVKNKRELSDICSKYGIKIVISCETTEIGQGQVEITSNDKHRRRPTEKDIQQAGEDFVTLYQTCFQRVIIKRIPCKGVGGLLNKAISVIWTELPSVLVEDSMDEEVTLVGVEKEVEKAIKTISDVTSKPRKLKMSTSSGLSKPSGTDKPGLDSSRRSSNDGGTHRHTAGWQPVPMKVNEKFRTTEGIEVIVRKDDITEQHVDVIVNASSCDLTHYSGVAGALQRAAGPGFQEECNKKVISGPLSVTDCVHTGSYKLPCLYVIHAVGPMYDNARIAENDFFTKLQDTFRNCFEHANNLKAKSIAVPLISSGAFSGPKELCAKALVGAIKEYSKLQKNNTMEKIILVNNDDKATHALLKAMNWIQEDGDDEQMDTTDTMNNTKKAEKKHFWTEKVTAGSGASGAFKHSVDQQSTEISQSRYPLSDKNATQSKVYGSSDDVQIVVGQQDILKSATTVDAVIVSTDNTLNHYQGIAYEVQRAAGSKISEACREIMTTRNFPLKMGDIVHTHGFKLGCDKVIFVVAPEEGHFSGGRQDFFDKLRKVVYDCMVYAEKTLKVKSVALPMFPSDSNAKELCASAFAKAIHQFRNDGSRYVKRILILNDDFETNMALHVAFGDELKDDGYQDTEVYASHAHVSYSNIDRNKSDNNGVTDRHGHFNSNDSVKFGNEDSDSGESDEEDKKCPICFDDFSDAKPPVDLSKCKHKFCKECLDTAMSHKPVCPVCGQIYGVMKGNQPDGRMDVSVSGYPSLPGYEGCGTITINYSFRDGVQESNHPNPGRRYRGTSRTAYLPNNTEGKKVAGLLKKAFDARLTFTIGTSVTTGAKDTVTWNDIHHKTTISGGAQHFGYPDPTYLQRVTEELAAKGIK